MITIAICDDEKIELTKIASLISRWITEQTLPDIFVRTFSSAYDLLAAAEKGELFDIFLLDILMPEMTGISLGERLRELFLDPLLIFLTSSEDYYPDAFRLYAYQYLLKPVDQTALHSVLDKVLLHLSQHEPTAFPLKTADGLISIELSTILFAELSNHVCYFHLTDNSIVQSRFLRTRFESFIEPLMQASYFAKSHTSYVVNMKYIQKISGGSLLMTNGDSVPIARSCSALLKNCYLDFMMKSSNFTLNSE